MSNSAFIGGAGLGGASVTLFTSQTSVTVTHNFNTYPIVDVTDENGAVLVPLTITHNSTTPALCTATTVTFDVSKSGRIVLSYGAVPGATGPQGQVGIGVVSGGTTGQALVKTSNTDYATTWANVGFTTSVITGDTNAVKDYLYILTGGSTIVLTLPASPSTNDKVAVVNLTSVLTCSVARNGNNIMGLAQDLTLDKANAGFTMVYSGATNGWVII